jgi:hypothetical protein
MVSASVAEQDGGWTKWRMLIAILMDMCYLFVSGTV